MHLSYYGTEVLKPNVDCLVLNTAKNSLATHRSCSGNLIASHWQIWDWQESINQNASFWQNRWNITDWATSQEFCMTLSTPVSNSTTWASYPEADNLGNNWANSCQCPAWALILSKACLASFMSKAPYSFALGSEVSINPGGGLKVDVLGPWIPDVSILLPVLRSVPAKRFCLEK